MQNTNFLLPQTLITSNGWTSPSSILVQDGTYAVATATPTLTSELVVGNFLFNLPSNAVVQGIEIELRGKRGILTNPASTLQIYAYDNTNNNNALYHYTPVFAQFDTVDGVFNLGSNIYTFGQTLTAEQVNNLKFRLIANSEIYVDSFKVRVYYAEPSVYIDTFQSDSCQTIIQAQKFNLIDNVSSTATEILINKFETPDGLLITNADIDPFHITQGKGIPITVSHATRREENMYVTAIEHLTTGYVRLTVTRGWSFKQPVGQLSSRQKAHPSGNEVIISNSTPFYDEFLKKCHIGTLVSAPIKVEDEGINITNYLRKLNFKGAGVVANSTPAVTGGGHDVDVTIAGYGNSPITIVNTTTVTSGGNQVTNLSTNITSEGTDTALIVALSLEAGKTVTGVTYNSIPLIFAGSQNQNDVRVEVWYIANPSGGNHTITATFSAATYSCFEAMSLAGVNQSTPLVGLTGNSGNTLASVGVVTTLTENSTFFHALATRDVGITYTAVLGETINGSSLSGAVQGAIASRLIGTPSTQSSQINLSILNDWANLLFAIQPTPVSLPPSGTDELVKISATDTTASYLGSKLVAGSGVTLTTLNPGANEQIQISSTGGGSGTDITQTITQTAHGFIVGDWVRSSYVSGQYTKAQADTADNSAVIGLVTSVPNANTFELTKVGSATITTGYPIGDALWLSPTTAGAMTNVEPTTIGQIRQPLGYVVGTNEIDIKIQRGDDVTASSGGGTNKLVIDTTATSYTLPFTGSSYNGSSTLYTIPISGGLLKTNNAIRVTVLGLRVNIGATCTMSYTVTYGGQTIENTNFLDTSGAGVGTASAELSFIITANNATNAQKSVTYSSNTSIIPGVFQKTYNSSIGSQTVDTTITQNIIISVTGSSSAGNTFNCDGYIIELIS